MSQTIYAKTPYQRRPVPPVYTPGWFEAELGSVARALWQPTTITVKANYTATITDYAMLCDATAGALAVTLPQPAQVQNLLLVIKKVDGSANAVTITGVVDGVTNPTLPAQYTSLTVLSDGVRWNTIAST